MTSEKERLDSAKKKLWSTLSQQKFNGVPDSGTEIVYKDIAVAIKLNQSKAAWHQSLAGVPQGRSAADTTRDTTGSNTKNGVPFVGNYPITCRGKNYLELLAEQKAKDNSEPTSVPAVRSGQTGTANWSPDSAGEPDGEFNAADAKADLIKAFTGADGKIRKQQAQKWILTVNGDGSDPDQNNVPLGTVSPVSQMIYYHPDALSEAFKHASGDYNATVNRSLQNRVVRIAQHNKLPLTGSMQDHVERHMSASAFYDVEPTDAEKAAAQLEKYDEVLIAASCAALKKRRQ